MDSRRLKLYSGSLNYLLRSIFSGKKVPLTGGIAINDRCNLHCRHCFVSNRNIPDMSYEEVKEGLIQLYQLGTRYLYIEGGEPFIWHDGQKNTEDIIRLARQTGFNYIIIYTNGTFPVETGADAVFVSIDGLKETHEAMRGKCYDRIIANISQSSHKKIFANFTVTAKNCHEIISFCMEIQRIKNLKGTCFYFYTPYNGPDDLYLNSENKKKAVEDILYLKKKGLPVLNSTAALKSFLHNDWKRPDNLAYLYAENRLYRCCRAIGNEDICRECGYLGFTELYHISRLNPDALRTAFKYL